MFKLLFDVFRSSKFMDILADEIGVDRKIYKAALTEAGINFALYEGMFNASELSEQETLRALAFMLCEPAFAGALRLATRFPTQQSIETFLYRIEQYAETRRSEIDEAESEH